MINKYYRIAKNNLFPLTRSLTGKGVRKTLKIIKDEFPEVSEAQLVDVQIGRLENLK